MNSIQELERFFELDLKVKKLIESSRPNMYDRDSVEIEKDLLKTIEMSRSAINQMLFLARLDLEEEFNELFDKIKQNVESSNYNIDKLTEVYENDILKMTDGFEELLEKYIGAYQEQMGQLYIPLKKCSTINDMLHYVHFCVVNSENTYKNMNLLDIKNEGKYEWLGYKLYGREDEVARDIFNNLPDGETAIDELSFNNHILLMVRDRGHALSIDAEKEENDNYRVSYFIPKVCNVGLVNNLKGVKKLDIENSGPFSSTHGEFLSNKENIGRDINEFIRSVPTDEYLEKNSIEKNSIKM